MPELLTWTCPNCGFECISPVLALDEWAGHVWPVGPDCAACGHPMLTKAVPILNDHTCKETR